jgi:hypothetical protein
MHVHALVCVLSRLGLWAQRSEAVQPEAVRLVARRRIKKIAQL